VLLRDGQLNPVIDRPMNAEFAYVSPEVMPEYHSALSQLVKGVQSGFLWNMDEFGHADWSDEQTETVYDAEELEADLVPIPVS
jgi:hypothetical protein